jgi:hypothetical protein
MRDLITSLLESERIAAGAQRAAAAKRWTWPRWCTRWPRCCRPAAVDAGLDGPAPVPADATRLRCCCATCWTTRCATAPMRRSRRRSSCAARPTAGWRWACATSAPACPTSQLARLAQAFYRPDSARTRAAGGVGLGLYLCRLVAQAHGGELRIRNAAPGLEVAMVWARRADG